MNTEEGKKKLNNTFKSQAQQEGSVKNLTKAQIKSKDATGSATSATMELSRVISDAPYGIRGMANNITQLVSQLGTASTKAGGFRAAINLMIGQLSGPLGIVFAITAVVSALDFFYGANKKAEESTNDHAESLKGLEKTLSKLYTTQNNLNKKFDEYATLAKLRKETDDLMKKEAIKLAEVNKKIADQEEYNAIAKKRMFKGEAKREEVLNKLLVERNIIYKVTTDAQTKLNKKTEEFNSAKEGTVEALEKEKSKAIAYQKTISDTSDIWKEEALKIKKIQDKIDAITGGEKKKTKLLEIKDFDKQVEDYLSQIASVSEKEEILNATLNSDKVRIQEEYHLKRLDIKNEENKAKFKQQSDAYRIEYEAFLNQEVSLGNLTKKEAEVKLNKFDTDAKAEQGKSDANYKILLSKWNTYYTDKLFIALSGEMKVAETEEDANAKRLKDITTFIEQYKVLTSAVNDFLQAESERELTIEQNKTNVLNTELNNRLNNENLSKEQRKSIQDEILRNDEKLRVKQNAIKKKAFMTQKAFNISTAIVNTVSAGIGAAAATYGGPLAKLAAMTAVIGAGMAQVAIIARQKFQPEAANTPVNTGGGGSSSGGSSVRSEPSFNIVGGRTKEDALLGAIQAQFDQPLKAYVVSGDVTSQQELDRVIVSSSSL